MYVFKTAEFENIWWRIESRTNELAEQGSLDIYHVLNITRAFSRAQHNRMVGANKTFYNLEPVVLKNLDNVSDRDATHLMYSYSVREAGNPELYAAFDKRLEKMVHNLDYPSLFNAIYYLLFRENANPELWKGVIASTLAQDDTLPLIYYKPFKASNLFMKHHFPDWNLSDYTDKFFYSENYFNTMRMDDNYERDKEYINFKIFMTGHCLVFPIQFINFHNLLHLHFCFNEFKIAINFHLKKYSRPFDCKPS